MVDFKNILIFISLISNIIRIYAKARVDNKFKENIFPLLDVAVISAAMANVNFTN